MAGPFDVKHSDFHRLIPADSEILRVATGFEFTEGPVYNRQDFLLFSDLPSERILKFTLPPTSRGPADGELSEFRVNSSRANGLTFDHQGRLLACETGLGRVTRTEKNGVITVLADRYAGRLLNSPNDLVYNIDGSVYFTDLPRQGQPTGPEHMSHGAIYQIPRRGALRMVFRDGKRSNGVALGPKQLTLFAADSAERNIRVFDIAADGTLRNTRVFAELNSPAEGAPDGLKTDEGGNVYCTGPGGLWVFNPEGTHLGTIVLPELPSNCCWGRGFRGLYITARTSVYHVRTAVSGTRTF
jgi:gluconolactonase